MEGKKLNLYAPLPSIRRIPSMIERSSELENKKTTITRPELRSCLVVFSWSKPLSCRYRILSRNHFSGGIPKEYGSFENLEVLDLRENDLSGQIPPELSNGLSLKHL